LYFFQLLGLSALISVNELTNIEHSFSGNLQNMHERWLKHTLLFIIITIIICFEKYTQRRSFLHFVLRFVVLWLDRPLK
jgi:hypothetical protein